MHESLTRFDCHYLIRKSRLAASEAVEAEMSIVVTIKAPPSGDRIILQLHGNSSGKAFVCLGNKELWVQAHPGSALSSSIIQN